MNIRTRDILNITSTDGIEHIVRAGTVGVEKNKTVYFYDTTRTCAVGFPRDFCLNTPSMFTVSRTIEDREVPISDVLSVVETIENPQLKEKLTEMIKAL